MATNWTILTSGFLQQSDKPDRVGLNGTLRLYEQTMGRFSAPDNRILLYEYDVRVKNVARWIRDTVVAEEGQGQINLFGYSWGGQAMVDLAWELGRAGVVTHGLLLCDAVKRYRGLAKVRTWRLFRPERVVIPVPATVKITASFKQPNGWPRGSVVKATPHEEHEFTGDDVNHYNIDERIEVWKRWFQMLGVE